MYKGNLRSNKVFRRLSYADSQKYRFTETTFPPNAEVIGCAINHFVVR